MEIFILIIIVIIILGIILLNNTIYCYIFEKDAWNAYHDLLNLPIDEFYKYADNIPGAMTTIYCKSHPDWSIILWHREKKCSIHYIDIGIVAGTFFKKYSKKLYYKLENI